MVKCLDLMGYVERNKVFLILHKFKFSIIIISIVILASLSPLYLHTSRIIRPLSIDLIYIGDGYSSLLTYSFAYLAVGFIGTIQLFFDTLLMLILLPRAERIFGVWTAISFFLGNLLGGIFVIHFDVFLGIKRPYVGCYPGIMSVFILYVLYRPRIKQLLFIVFPGGFALPYRSRLRSIALMNLGVSICSIYYRIIPINYICFESYLVSIILSFIIYKFVLARCLYKDKFGSMRMLKLSDQND